MRRRWYVLLLSPLALMWLPGTAAAGHVVAPPGPALPAVISPPAQPVSSFQVTLTRP